MTTWNVNIEFEGVDVKEENGDQIDELFEPLLTLGPVASFEPGRLGVWVTVDASTPEAALRAAKREVVPAMVGAQFGRGRLVAVEN